VDTLKKKTKLTSPDAFSIYHQNSCKIHGGRTPLGQLTALTVWQGGMTGHTHDGDKLCNNECQSTGMTVMVLANTKFPF